MILLTPLLLTLTALIVVAIIEGLRDIILQRRKTNNEVHEDRESIPPKTASIES